MRSWSLRSASLSLPFRISSRRLRSFARSHLVNSPIVRSSAPASLTIPRMSLSRSLTLAGATARTIAWGWLMYFLTRSKTFCLSPRFSPSNCEPISPGKSTRVNSGTSQFSIFNTTSSLLTSSLFVRCFVTSKMRCWTCSGLVHGCPGKSWKVTRGVSCGAHRNCNRKGNLVQTPSSRGKKGCPAIISITELLPELSFPTATIMGKWMPMPSRSFP
mmetsp:Transcript_112504/g.281837  ORF Transcript_112504/g.281837 Transcript_112504/m.281837 type:complete len:216 (+) Transcript_112504:340-987(+)